MKPWVVAIGLSLALHLGLVLVFRDVAPALPRGEKVQERGAPFVAFTPVSVVSRPRDVAPVVPLKKASPIAVSAVQVAATPVSPQPDPLPRGGEGDGVERVEGGEDVEGGGVADVSGVAGGPHPEPPPASQGEGDVVIALVHARLAAVADRCYPAAARRFQQRGTVQVSFCTDARGAAANTAVTQSSGAELLDAAARGCVVEQASPFPHEAASRCFAVPVRFGAR